jgi:hypothetical protein
MRTRVRKEEMSTLGDFIRVSFVRDQAVSVQRFPKMNAIFLSKFTEHLEGIKIMESTWVMTQQQKAISESLYEEAANLNKELNFLKRYLTRAKLNIQLLMALKNDLFSSNIEAATEKLESLKQYVDMHKTVLQAEGMAEDFVETLQDFKMSLMEKNTLQNSFMNDRKALTQAQKAAYGALQDYIFSIMDAGRLVFDGTVTKDDYSLSKNIQRMRAPKPKKDAA